MQSIQFFNPRAGRLLIPAFALCLSSQVMAQAPSSLSYPTPNVFIANVSNVFLSPNLAGNVNSYSITPALPAGLSFNTNTGVISGVPTAASAAITYTITATGSSGSTNTTTSIQVTNNYFNNNYNTLQFGGTGVTVINGSTGATISNTTTNTHGHNAGEIVVYRNVVELSGQAIDCIVKTVATSGISSWSAYDQASSSGSGYSNNDPGFFSPMLSFAAGTSSGPGGSVTFNFQFILGGSYSTTTQSGIPVVLQNVKINSYDIDGNGQTNSNQINEFGGFSTSEVGSGTSLQAPIYNSTTGLTTYRSSISDNITNATSDQTRIRLTYNNMSNFTIRMGGGGSCYFFVDFSSGPAFSTAVSTPAPSIDLNTSLVGVNNANSGCGTMLSFTPSGQSNITASGNLTQLRVSFPTADIANGSSEQLVVNGATNGTFALNSNPSVSNMSFNGTTYSVNGSVSAGIRTLVFTRNSGNFTVSNAEALLDALNYNNSNSSPTPGSRNFTVNVRNTSFESPDAIFTATLNCVSISGHVYHDVNGMVDSLVNATGSSQLAANEAYVIRVNPANNQVIDTRAIDAGGAFSFGTVTPGSYAFYLSNTSVAQGTTFTTATFPTGYIATSENLGADAGNDLLTDGKLLITVGSSSITDANFGLQIPPVTTNNTINNIANPGGFNGYTLPGNAFPATDADGVIDSLVISSFPAGANYLKVGNTVYTSGGTCPPQSVCTPWPGAVVIPVTGGSPVPAIAVDPAAEGNTAVTINFAAWDNGRAQSNSSTLTINFIGTSYHSISGKVWNDINGNGLQAGAENNVAPADAGQTLYALLVQENHTYSGVATLLAVTPVNAATGYSFTNVPEGNDYTLRIVSATTAPVTGAAASTVTPHLAQGWTAVSTNANGSVTSNLNTSDPGIALLNLSTNKTGQNFGIEQLPEAANASANVPYPSVGTLYTLNGVGGNPPVPSANDPEDGPLGAGNTIVITTLPQFTTLIYDNVPVTLNQVISNFDPAKLQVKITASTIGQTGTSFEFTYRDAAGIADPTPATYSLNWTTPLPVTMGTFTATREGAEVRLDWSTFKEERNTGFGVERSTDSRQWQQIGFVPTAAAEGNSNDKLDYTAYDGAPATGVNYYRLKQVDADGKVTYSEIRQVAFGSDNAISIYPNPTTDRLHIEVRDWSKVTEVRVSDINGKMVFRAKEAMNGISLGQLSRGTYLVQVEQTNGNIANFKIVKQ